MFRVSPGHSGEGISRKSHLRSAEFPFPGGQRMSVPDNTDSHRRCSGDVHSRGESVELRQLLLLQFSASRDHSLGFIFSPPPTQNYQLPLPTHQLALWGFSPAQHPKALSFCTLANRCICEVTGFCTFSGRARALGAVLELLADTSSGLALAPHGAPQKTRLLLQPFGVRAWHFVDLTHSLNPMTDAVRWIILHHDAASLHIHRIPQPTGRGRMLPSNSLIFLKFALNQDP